MRYVGSKNKLSKDLAPIIQSHITCIYEKEVKTLLDSNKSSGDDSSTRIERLYIYNK